MEFSKQKYCSGLPFPFPGDHPDAGIEPKSPTLWADSLPSEPPGKPIYGSCPSGPQRVQEMFPLLTWHLRVYASACSTLSLEGQGQLYT